MSPAPDPPPPGVFVPVPTFFAPRSASSSSAYSPAAVDYDTQCAHSLMLARAGIHGLVLLGSTGEAVHMSRAERAELVRRVRAHLAAEGFPAYPLVAGVLTNAVGDALEELEAMRAAGAQWGLVLAPGYFGAAADQANLVAWYTAVADGSPIPIMIYHYPGVTNNVQVEVSTYATLAAHRNIVGAKLSHGNVSHHLQVSLHPRIDHARFRLYSGFGQQLFAVVAMGGAGVVDGLAAAFPKTVVRLYELSVRRPLDDAALDEVRRLQYVVSAAEELVVRWGIKGIKEAVWRAHGMGNGDGGRAPLEGNMGSDWDKWAVELEAIGAIESAL